MARPQALANIKAQLQETLCQNLTIKGQSPECLEKIIENEDVVEKDFENMNLKEKVRRIKF
jgi:hypothetical protein